MKNKLLIINSCINSTSTGRIAEEIGKCAKSQDFDVTAAYGFLNNNSQLHTIKVGNRNDHYFHALYTRITDRHAFASKTATKELVDKLETLNPDIINLHNVHGYYLNIEVLFDYLIKHDKPVVWTLHDCWPFTGHCSYFDAVNCDKFKTGCNRCPNSHAYPATKFLDASARNYKDKKRLFTALKQLTMVAPCNWMADNVRASFLKNADVKVIYNGVNTDQFRPAEEKECKELRKKFAIDHKKVILGVASVWDRRKGLEDFKKMAASLNDNEQIILIGLDDKQIENLPENILGIKRTENVEQLAAFYSLADVFANPTYVDNFPTTNIEALACGTPVVTYRTGGSPEAIDAVTGKVVEKGDTPEMLKAIRELFGKDREEMHNNCRRRAEQNFKAADRFDDYAALFKEKLKM